MTHGIITTIVLALGLTFPAAAEILEFEFTGNIEGLEGGAPAPWSDVELGAPFVVRYVFDSEAPDLNTSKSAGLYAVHSAEFIIDGIAVIPAMNEISIDVFFPAYQFQSQEFGLDGEFFGGITFADPTGTHIVNDDLLLDIDLDRLDVGFEFGALFDTYFFGLVTGFSSQVVPAPASALVLLPCLTPRRRRRDA